MKKIVLGVVVLALVSAAAIAAKRHLDGERIVVQVARAEVGAITTSVSATGTVINREEMTINSPGQGEVVLLNAGEGDAVKKGLVLARLDDRDNRSQIGKARATLRISQQNEDDAKRAYARVQQIFAVGGEARKTLEEAELRLQTMNKEKLVAQEDLHQALAQRERFALSAPVDGIITARAARVGTWVSAGDPLFRLAPAGVREIEVKLDAGDSAAVAVGKVVEAASDAYPGKNWTETITWIAPVTSKDGAANFLAVRISLSPHAPPLVLGQQVDVKIPMVSRSRIVKIPLNATITKQGKRFVAILVDDKIQLLPIVTGVEDLKYSEVTHGLVAGQQIILSEGQALREGAKVTIASHGRSK
ncbi:MAG: efflux RND transporter periplasmic adaptor subunit [Telluria sp.]|nr:efflux RND transporter periplasmic adaptor subunit [Telluria sp.]